MLRTKSITDKMEVTTTKSKKPAAKKRKKTTETKGKAKTAKTTPNSIKSNAIKTPEKSEIVLDYHRYGNVGFSSIHEVVDISNIPEKELKKRWYKTKHKEILLQ